MRRPATDAGPRLAPVLDAQYRAGDTLSERHARTLQARAIARLRTYSDSYDVPVLLTRTERDAFTKPIQTAADRTLTCEQTRLGLRFVGDEFETLVYPLGDGTYQTTFAYWRHVLGVRAEQVGLEPAGTPQAASPSSPVGTAVTATGETTTPTVSPLLDAQCGAGGR